MAASRRQAAAPPAQASFGVVRPATTCPELGSCACALKGDDIILPTVDTDAVTDSIIHCS